MSKPEDSGLERDYCAGLLSSGIWQRYTASVKGRYVSALKMAGYATSQKVRKKYAGTQNRYAKEVRTVEKKR